MQARCRKRHDLVARGFVDQAVFEQGAIGRHQGAELLQIFDGRCHLDLRERGLAVVAFDEGGHFGGPDALTRHGADIGRKLLVRHFRTVPPEDVFSFAIKRIV